MHVHHEPITLLDERLVEAVEVVILPGDEMVVRVLDLEDIFKLAGLVLYLGLVVYLYRAYVVQLDGETERLKQADWCLRQDVVGLFDSEEAFVGAESGALEVEHQRLSIFDLEDDLEEVDLIGAATQFDVFQRDRTVDQLDVLDLVGLQPSHLRLDLEDVVLNDRLFVGLLLGGLSWIRPELLLHLIIRGKLEDIIQGRSSVVPDSDEHLPWLRLVFGGNVTEVPIVVLEAVFQRLCLGEGQRFDSEVFLLIAVQFAP